MQEQQQIPRGQVRTGVLLESNFDGWVTFFRIVLAVLAVVFLAIGFEGPD